MGKSMVSGENLPLNQSNDYFVGGLGLVFSIHTLDCHTEDDIITYMLPPSLINQSVEKGH